MKKSISVKNMDVDLNSLQFFNSEEFNKSMSNLINQDTLTQKSRDEIFNKIKKVFDFYQALKEINESGTFSTNKQAQLNSLLSSNGFSSVEALEEYINNELIEISNIINVKTDQMGIFIVDYSSCITDEINQRIDELSDSANEKLSKAENELQILQSALSSNTDYIEAEIERKTEKLGNEIQNMTNQVTSTQLTVIKPHFSSILKRLFNEREIAKKNYKFASKSLKGSYPAPKSLFRCFCEAYFEYLDEKEMTKNNSDEGIQTKILQKSQRTAELKTFLDTLRNKGNLELEKAKQESNLALELFPALDKLINTTIPQDLDSLENKINNIKTKSEDAYPSLLNKMQINFPDAFSKQTLKLIVNDNEKINNPNQSSEEIITGELQNTSTNDIEEEILPQEEIISTENNITITSTPYVETNNIKETIEITSEAELEPITSDIETIEENSFEIINDITENQDITIEKEINEEETNKEEINDAHENKDITLEHIIEEEINNINENDVIETQNIIKETNKAPRKNADKIINKKSDVKSTSAPTPSLNFSKENLEKTRMRTQEKLQKAQEKFDKETAKAQEKLERANAKAQLELCRMKTQAFEILKNAIETANNIVEEANQKSLTLIENADISAKEVIEIANQTSKNIVITAEVNANQIIGDAQEKAENMKAELEENCKSILETANQKADSITVTANQKSEELLVTSKNKADDILANIDNEIQNRKNKIIELRKYINNSEGDITTLTERIENYKLKIKKIEILMSTAQDTGGLDDEINDLETKLNKLTDGIQNSIDTIEQLKIAVEKSQKTITEFTRSLPNLRENLEAKAKEILETSKITATSIVEKAQAEAKITRDKSRLTVSELTEETNNTIEILLTEARMQAQKLKEDAQIEADQIIEQANKKSQFILDSAQNESKELKENAETTANTIKETKKSELEFILTEEEIKKVC